MNKLLGGGINQWALVKDTASRERIDPIEIDWSKNDTTIAKQVGYTRERIRQMRLECFLWSLTDWGAPDEEIAKIMSKLLSNVHKSRPKGKRGCHLSRVVRHRARKDWLEQNQHNFFGSDDYYIHNTDARQRLAQLATETMSFTQIVRAVGRNKAWVKAAMAELGKSHKPKNYLSGTVTETLRVGRSPALPFHHRHRRRDKPVNNLLRKLIRKFERGSAAQPPRLLL